MRMVDDLEKLFEEKNKTSYITLISSKEELLPYYEAVKDSGKWETIFQKDTYRDEYWLEICPKDATKAKAVLKLKDKLKCDRIVVFGDSKNDLPMFEIADEAISVANAMQETLDASTLTIGSNEEDAVAKYIASETSLVKTRYGSFISYSGESELRKKNKEPVTYHENGEIASLYFEEIQKVHTPLGEVDAEYLTFYPDGSLKRLFPSYGQISGYWTEENEYGIAPEVEVTICGRTYKVHPLCIAFYPTGKVKSFTIYLHLCS